VLADSGVFAGGVHRTPDGAAVALCHAVREFSKPKRIPRRTKAHGVKGAMQNMGSNVVCSLADYCQMPAKHAYHSASQS
jgi:hypothetical protein